MSIIVLILGIGAKYLRITRKPDKTVKVTIPNNISYNKAQEFLLSKILWAKKHLTGEII